MLPASDDFAEQMTALGLDDADDLVVYDGSGINLSAARVWWMFRAMGHKDVAVLDGGLPKWMSEGHPVTDDPTPPRDDGDGDRVEDRQLANARTALRDQRTVQPF